MRDIGTAIEFLHNINIAHRDIKVRRDEDRKKSQSISKVFSIKENVFFIFSCLPPPARESAVHH